MGVDRGGGQRRGEIGEGREETGRTTNGLEVKKMIGGVRADEKGEFEVREGGVGRGSDERSRSADWEGPGGQGPLPGGHGGG